VTLDLRPVSDPEARSLLEDVGLVELGVSVKPAGPVPGFRRRRYRTPCAWPAGDRQPRRKDTP
jgi:hypothetical protein